MTDLIYASYDHMALLADYHAPEMHAHLCSHFALATKCSLDYETEFASGHAQGVFIGSDVRHTIQANRPLIIFFFDETSSIGRQIKERYLSNSLVSVAAGHLVSQTRRCFSDYMADRNPDRFDNEMRSILLDACSSLESSAPAVIDERIVDALAFLHAQDGIDRAIIDMLAERECLSKSRLSHLFTQNMGISLHRYLAFMKLKKAAEYIAQGNSLTDAAIRAGFDSPSHLSSTAKRMFGISLTEVMRSMQP